MKVHRFVAGGHPFSCTRPSCMHASVSDHVLGDAAPTRRTAWALGPARCPVRRVLIVAPAQGRQLEKLARLLLPRYAFASIQSFAVLNPLPLMARINSP